MLPVGDALEDYERVMQLVDSEKLDGFNLRPVPAPSSLRGPWAPHVRRYLSSVERQDIRVSSPAIDLGWASSRPAGTNDGFLWQGRGGTSRAIFGIYGRIYGLSAAFRPEFAYVQNRAFNAGPGNSTQYFGRATIDAPRRFGNKPIRLVHPGQSFIELAAFGVGVGVSTRNMWWGPALHNAIVMSNNGPGFGHAYLGTSRPVDAGIAHVQGKWFWGDLHESKFFEDDRSSERRHITGIVLEVQPHFIPGLYVGATRVFVQAKDENDGRDHFLIFQNFFKKYLEDEHDRFGFDENDQILSVFGRWVFPKSGFEFYGEYGVGDHSSDLRDAVVQFKHASGYTVGLQKVFAIGPKLLRANAELTRLEAPKSDILRVAGDAPGYSASPTAFYVNTIVRQGYTHKGQIIGAGIGPGSNSQYVGVDLFTTWGRAGWYAQRVVYDNDLFYSVSNDHTAHQVEFISGVGSLLFIRSFELVADVALRRFLNMYYETGNDEWNVTAKIGLRWNIGGYR